MPPERPRLLCLSGHDPGGGAGLQADIETAAAHGVHVLGLITALTVQDSRDIARVVAIDPLLLREQLDCLLADTRPAVIKLGLIGSAAQLPVIVDTIQACAVPVVCDPVLRAGGGRELAPGTFVDALREQLLPQVTVLTPNAAEARRLAPAAADLAECGRILLAAGCSHVLITGGDEAGSAVINRWQSADGRAQDYTWPRLPETFHGAGCTLAAAIAARLALGDRIPEALHEAQRWTDASLQHAFAIGGGRRIPGRLPT